MLTRSRALVGASAACLVALAVAGCGTGSSSSSSSSAVKITGNTLTIYLSEPSDLSGNTAAQDIVHAEQMAFSAHRSEVTDYKVVLQTVRYPKLSDNARGAIIDSSTIAYLGEIAPGASDQTVGITNALDVLQVSPTDNALELSEHSPVVPGSPQNFFEQWGTYGRTFARMVPSASEEATAQVAEMKSLGVTKLYVGNDGSDYGKAIAHAVSSDAQAAGLTVEPSVDEEVKGYFYGAQSPTAAARFFNHIASMAPNARLFGPSSLNASSFAAALSPAAAKNLDVSVPGYLPKDLSAEGKSFISAFRAALRARPQHPGDLRVRGDVGGVARAGEGGQQRQRPDVGGEGLPQPEQRPVGARHLLDRQRRQHQSERVRVRPRQRRQARAVRRGSGRLNAG